MENLVLLDLSDTGLDAVDEHIGALLNLKFLNLSKNNLTELLGEYVNKWRYLRFLDVSHNKISSLPKERVELILLLSERVITC